MALSRREFLRRVAAGVIVVPAAIKNVEIGCTSERVEANDVRRVDHDHGLDSSADPAVVGILAGTGELVGRNEAGYYIPYPYVQYQELGPSRLAVFGGPVSIATKEEMTSGIDASFTWEAIDERQT